MVDNKLTILIELARRHTEIEKAQVLEEFEAAQDEPLQGTEHMWADERLVASVERKFSSRSRRWNSTDARSSSRMP